MICLKTIRDLRDSNNEIRPEFSKLQETILRQILFDLFQMEQTGMQDSMFLFLDNEAELADAIKQYSLENIISPGILPEIDEDIASNTTLDIYKHLVYLIGDDGNAVSIFYKE